MRRGTPRCVSSKLSGLISSARAAGSRVRTLGERQPVRRCCTVASGTWSRIQRTSFCWPALGRKTDPGLPTRCRSRRLLCWRPMTCASADWGGRPMEGEALWAGEFGDAYTDRNRGAFFGRRPFWEKQVRELEVKTALEVGCNVGANLWWLAWLLGSGNVAGVDVNAKALGALRTKLPDVQTQLASAASLPFPDASFDLVFTVGLLIHTPDEGLHKAMSEIVRCTSRYVICCEYLGDEEVEYRGTTLFKRDYGYLYPSLFPDLLSTVDSGHLGGDSWDDITYWVFER